MRACLHPQELTQTRSDEQAVGVQAWEAEEAAYTHAVVQWKRDLRRYERDVSLCCIPRHGAP